MYNVTSFKSLFNKYILFCTISITINNANAKEGMWLPPTLNRRTADMKSLGLQIPIDKIYNEKGTGLNNAVVLFGRGCTGELISGSGLILTNHHCGYGSVQGLSNTEHDYFANGFWAKSSSEELPCPGLTVTFIRKMENVTEQVLKGLNDTMDNAVRDVIIAARIQLAEREYKEKTGMDAFIKPYYNGNQYWASLTETYRDIRLVGFPPNGIGSFGGDIENWAWPRHTGDFSLFRVYAGPDNKPADFSKNNKPYHTNNFFTINMGGYKEGDFTMVYGFPGTTQEYISSYELRHIFSISDSIRIQARTIKLDVLDKNMKSSRDVFIKYTSKRSGIANGWKKWQGEVRGLQLNKVPAKKQAYEHSFQNWANSSTAPVYAASILPSVQNNTGAVDDVLKADEYIRETVLGIELIQQSAFLDKFLPCFRAGLEPAALQDTLKKLAAGLKGFYKNYDLNTDRQLFESLMPLFFNNCGKWAPSYYQNQLSKHNNNYNNWASDVYDNSLLVNEEKLISFAAHASAKDSSALLEDPAWKLFTAINILRKQEIIPPLTAYNTRISYFDRLYMKCRMMKDKNKMFYPDANLTLRLAYGKIQGMDPDGPEPYSFQTDLGQVIAHDNPELEIFKVPQKLKDLNKKKDFGRWAVHGTVPVAFIASNHTSGGNSGSPVLNAKGQLIGTNFDRPWEGTMSDLYFDSKLCRNISLDVRYTLFIIEKFGDAGWLLKEMNIVGK